MRLARRGQAGAEVPVVLTDNGVLDAHPVTADFNAQFFGSAGLTRLAEAVAAGDLPPLDNADDLRVGSPIARPGAIACVGMNYAAHTAESGSTAPEMPIIFLKTPNTVVGPYDDVQIPRGSTRTDWEVELGIVIGRRASYLDSPAEALDHVAGFVRANDLSEREFQIDASGGQWSKGKCCPGFSPIGPWLATPDEVDHQDLELRSWVDGEPR